MICFMLNLLLKWFDSVNCTHYLLILQMKQVGFNCKGKGTKTKENQTSKPKGTSKGNTREVKRISQARGMSCHTTFLKANSVEHEKSQKHAFDADESRATRLSQLPHDIQKANPRRKTPITRTRAMSFHTTFLKAKDVPHDILRQILINMRLGRRFSYQLSTQIRSEVKINFCSFFVRSSPPVAARPCGDTF